MTDVFEIVNRNARILKLDFSSEEFAYFVQDNNLSPQSAQDIASVFEYLGKKKTETTIQTLLRLSRLPLKAPKTFDNFDFSVIKGKDTDRLKAFPTMAAIYAHQNVAFIGPAGTGKTHLAQAFGYECCQRGMKTYFIKMSELRDRFTAARRSGKEASVLNGLVRPSCLIIDEVGHCEFDKENTRLFFDLIDRRYNKEGNFNMVFASNKNPVNWRANFSEDDALLCALGRIFDEAIVFNLKGRSYRGKKLVNVALQTDRVKAPDSDMATPLSEKPEQTRKSKSINNWAVGEFCWPEIGDFR